MKQSRLSVLLVALVALSAIAGGAAALTSTDLSADAQSTTTEVAASDAVNYNVSAQLDGSDSGTLETIVLDYDATNVERIEETDVTVGVKGSEQDVASIDVVNETAVRVELVNGVSVDASNNDGFYVNTTGQPYIAPAEQGTEPVSIGIEDGGGDLVDEGSASIDVGAPTADSVAVISDRGALETETETFLGYEVPNIAGFGGQDFGTATPGETAVNASDDNATITYDVLSEDYNDRLSAAADGAEDEDWVPAIIATENGDPVRVYLDNASSDASGTYAVYDSDADEVVLHLGDDDYDGETTISDFEVVANKGWIPQLQTYGSSVVTNGFGFDMSMTLGMGSLAGLALVGGRRRLGGA